MSWDSCRAAGRLLLVLVLGAACPAASAADSDARAPLAMAILQQSPAPRGLCVLIEPPTPAAVVELARVGAMTIYAQFGDAAGAAQARRAAADAGLLGQRIFIADAGSPAAIGLASSLADLVIASPAKAPADAELLRVLRPGGKAIIGDRRIVRPATTGTDAWSHPYHGPDNNTLSNDASARYPYLTHFLAEPLFSSQPEVTVAAGGRVFKAFGHMTFRAYQNASINQLFAVSAYNGALLWKNELKPGFMIHRNTLIATADVLYMGDDQSCKLLDAATGKVTDQIIIPADLADGPVWKWMAIEDGVLYALIGAREVEAPVAKGTETRIGGWPWAMWPGYDYADPKTAWGFGRTFVAIDLKTRKILWNHREENYIDSRGLCMKDGRIYCYSPEKFLACLDARTGRDLWRTNDAGVLEAIGPNAKAQHYITGFSTSVYMRTNGKVLMFAGPQRRSLACVSASDGRLLWQKRGGNFQLVLRDNALYALGEQNGKSFKLDYQTGNVLAEFLGRRACTRATGSIDSVFCRAQEGTLRWDIGTDGVNHIAPMRPACHDGVIISDGLLFWGPWICGCHLTLVGIIGLTPAEGFDINQAAEESKQLQCFGGDSSTVQAFSVEKADWSAYRADAGHSLATRATIGAAGAKVLWQERLAGDGVVPSAPVFAGGSVFVGGTDGAVRALDGASGDQRWCAYTGASIFFPPAIHEGRAFVASNDGCVYALEAASGRALWRFRVAPAQRDLPVYGEMMSTWPVAGGVVVDGTTVYAAAGISHFDGTHVCALDAASGRLKWHNHGAAGTIDPAVKNGVSLCGPLQLSGSSGGELRFPGGNVFPMAQFDAKDGRCLNKPVGPRTSKRMFLFPRKLWEPLEGAQHDTPLGQVRIQSARNGKSYTVALQPAGRADGAKAWSITVGGYAGSAASAQALVALSRSATDGPQAPWTLSALSLKDGAALWSQTLEAAPVHHGLAIDAQGRIAVALENGQVLCLATR